MNKLSPFQRASLLHSSQSSPASLVDLEDSLMMEESCQLSTAKEGLRAHFDCPEAIEGFRVKAYRPPSLSLTIGSFTEDEDASNGEETLDLAGQLSAIRTMCWPDEEDTALSIASSPRLQRTDTLVTYFMPPRNVTAMQRASMDASIGAGPGLDRSSLEIFRSSSLPSQGSPLRVDDIWRDMPTSKFNPFDGIPDATTCPFFQPPRV